MKAIAATRANTDSAFARVLFAATPSKKACTSPARRPPITVPTQVSAVPQAFQVNFPDSSAARSSSHGPKMGSNTDNEGARCVDGEPRPEPRSTTRAANPQSPARAPQSSA